jgi:hypothetical protein
MNDDQLAEMIAWMSRRAHVLSRLEKEIKSLAPSVSGVEITCLKVHAYDKKFNFINLHDVVSDIETIVARYCDEFGAVLTVPSDDSGSLLHIRREMIDEGTDVVEGGGS